MLLKLKLYLYGGIQSVYITLYLPDLFLQVIDDITTFLLRGKISTVCFPADGALSITATFFEESNLSSAKNTWHTAGIELWSSWETIYL